MFTPTVFQKLLLERRLVLWPIQQATGSERVNSKLDNFQNVLRKCQKNLGEDVDETDEIWHKKKKINEDDIEESIVAIAPAASSLRMV